MNTETPSANQDLGLYSYSEFKSGKHKLSECVPELLEAGHDYPFMKAGHWNYADDASVTLLELAKDDVLFKMRAMVRIEESSFMVEDGQSYTQGMYRVEELLES